jgi:hypothetical protein
MMFVKMPDFTFGLIFMIYSLISMLNWQHLVVLSILQFCYHLLNLARRFLQPERKEIKKRTKIIETVLYGVLLVIMLFLEFEIVRQAADRWGGI